MRKDEELKIKKVILKDLLINSYTVDGVSWRTAGGKKNNKLYSQIYDARKDTVDVRGKRLKSLARAYGINFVVEEKDRKLLINITLHDPTNDINTNWREDNP